MKTVLTSLLVAVLSLSASSASAGPDYQSASATIQVDGEVTSCDGCRIWLLVTRSEYLGFPTQYYVHGNMIGAPYIWSWETSGKLTQLDEFVVKPTGARVSGKFLITWGTLAGQEAAWTADCTADESGLSSTVLNISRGSSEGTRSHGRSVYSSQAMRCSFTFDSPGQTDSATDAFGTTTIQESRSQTQ